MILKNKDIREPTAEEVAEMKVWSDDGTYRKFAENSTTNESLVYVTGTVNYLIYITQSGDVELQYYYYFSEFTNQDGTIVPKGCWVYYSVNDEFTAYTEQIGNIHFEETDVILYSGYISAVSKEIAENQIYLANQKGIVLKTGAKYCESDIEVAPLLQKKVVTSNGIVTPDKGFSGLDGVLVEVPFGVIPSGTKEIKKNKATYDVREYAEAYVNIEPEDLNLHGLEVTANGEYTPSEGYDGIYYIKVNVSGDMPALQEKKITENGEYTPDENYNGFSKVNVNIQPALEDKTITKNGTYTASSDYDGFGKIVVKVASEVGEGKHLARYVNFDGRVLKQQYLNKGETFDISSIQRDTTYQMNYYGGEDDFIIQNGISCPVEISNGAVTVDRDITITNLYRAQSGASYFDITLNKVTGLTVTLKKPTTTFYGPHITYWGDGTASSTWSHTYSDYGDYTIKITGLTSIPAYFFGSSDTQSAQYCTRAFLSQWIKAIDAYAFNGCKSLKTITLPASLESIGEYAFYGCSALTSIAMPSTVTSIGDYAFSKCSSLFSVALPYGLTSLSGTGIFADCKALNSISLPDSLTGKLGEAIFQNCSSLSKIYIPSGITTIKAKAFSGNEKIMEYDFSTHISGEPALSNANAFTDINAQCKIIVPTNRYDDWTETYALGVTTPNKWADVKDYLYKSSEV